MKTIFAKEETLILLEAARFGLQGENYDELAAKLDLSDETLLPIRERLQAYLDSTLNSPAVIGQTEERGNSITTVDELFNGIDGQQFKAQRNTLSRVIDTEGYRPDEDDLENLEGLRNLCDAIADVAHDYYEKDTLCFLDDHE